MHVGRLLLPVLTRTLYIIRPLACQVCTTNCIIMFLPASRVIYLSSNALRPLPALNLLYESLSAEAVRGMRGMTYSLVILITAGKLVPFKLLCSSVNFAFDFDFHYGATI